MYRNVFIRTLLLTLFTIILTAPLYSAEQFPKSDWKDQLDPLAGADARPGGEIVVFGGQYPKSLNYYLDNNSFSAEVFSVMYETLLSNNPISLDYEPGIADQWSVSDDKRTFIFHIDASARWSDGKPITAADVRWTYDVIMNPKNMTGPHKINMERFFPPKVVDERTIVFVARNVHWKNLLALGGFNILPKHAFKNLDFNKINFEFPVLSGPYRPGPMDEGTSIKLKRRHDWWQNDRLRYRNKFNFETVTFKFFAEQENAFEAFKKGNIDLFPVYTSRIWIKETNGAAFFNNRIIKQKIFNHQPVGFQGFAMNMRRFPFEDVRVRKAMALLLNREEMNRTLTYNQYFLHNSYFQDLYSDKRPCPNPILPLDKDAARKLLAEAGWKVNPATGYLEKDGRRFSFKFLSRDASSDKFLSIYAEDLKDVGIELTIDKKDWAAWARDMEEFNYQMTWAAWSSGIFKDPESMWASSEADRKGGTNITGFKNPDVDRLIEKQKSIFEMNERNEIYRQMDQIIFKAHPYVLLWNINYIRLLYWNKFGTPPTVLTEYGDENGALWYWWADPDAAAALSDANYNDQPLAPKQTTIRFDELFKPAPGEKH